MGLARIREHKLLGICPTQTLRIRRQVAEMLGLDVFVEAQNFEFEDKLAFSSTCCLVGSCFGGKWSDNMSKAWRRRIFDAGSWKKVRGPAFALRCALRDVDVQLPDRDIFAFGDTLLDRWTTSQSDNEGTLGEERQAAQVEEEAN